MRVFLIAALCTGLAYAKPQYNYPAPPPSGSYGTPSGSYGTPQGGSISGFSQQGGGSTFTSGGASAASFGGFSSQSVGIGGGFGSGSSESSFTGGKGIGDRQLGGSFGSGSAASGGVGIGGGGVSIGGGGTLVQKHIYVHVAPPEPEESRPQRPISTGQATKHYKIIFIKAPSYDVTQQQIIAQQAQSQEKTLVYVLVKKPEEAADITIPTAAPTAPSKPEVYFIRYKAKSEVTGGGGATSQLSGSGSGISGATGSLSLSSASSASSQFNQASSINLSTGDSSSSVSVGRPQTNYGPPGQSGPYRK